MSESFVVLPSERVAELASDCIKTILECRERARNSMIEKALERERNRSHRLRKLFRRPIPTEAEIIEAVKQSDAYYNVGLIGGYSYNIAKRLLRAALVAPHVHISLSDLDRLMRP